MDGRFVLEILLLKTRRELVTPKRRETRESEHETRDTKHEPRGTKFEFVWIAAFVATMHISTCRERFLY